MVLHSSSSESASTMASVVRLDTYRYDTVDAVDAYGDGGGFGVLYLFVLLFSSASSSFIAAAAAVQAIVNMYKARKAFRGEQCIFCISFASCTPSCSSIQSNPGYPAQPDTEDQ